MATGKLQNQKTCLCIVKSNKKNASSQYSNSLTLKTKNRCNYMVSTMQFLEDSPFMTFSWNPKSNRCLKFQLFILTNKKVVFLKNIWAKPRVNRFQNQTKLMNYDMAEMWKAEKFGLYPYQAKLGEPNFWLLLLRW